LTARILLLLAGFLLIGLLLAALLAALIWIVGHWKRLLIAGQPRKLQRIAGPLVPDTRSKLSPDLKLMLHKNQ
jgi:hypothetical protein